MLPLTLPTGGRSRLVAMSFAGGKFKEIARTPHGAEIVTAVIAADLDGNGTADLVYGRRDGRVELIRR